MRLPQVPIHTAVVLGHPIRMYAHPTVEHGYLWSAMTDLAALVGYSPEGQALVVERWSAENPDKYLVAGDGTVIVSEAISGGFLLWVEEMGWPSAERAILERNAEVDMTFLRLTAHLPRIAVLKAAQQACLADALAIPGCHVQ